MDTNVDVKVKVNVDTNVDIEVNVDIDIDIDVEVRVNADTNIDIDMDMEVNVDVNRIKISTLVDTGEKALYYRIQIVSKSRIKQKRLKGENTNDLWLCTSKYQPTRIRHSNKGT